MTTEEVVNEMKYFNEEKRLQKKVDDLTYDLTRARFDAKMSAEDWTTRVLATAAVCVVIGGVTGMMVMHTVMEAKQVGHRQPTPACTDSVRVIFLPTNMECRLPWINFIFLLCL